jgi:hypothetical protein
VTFTKLSLQFNFCKHQGHRCFGQGRNTNLTASSCREATEPQGKGQSGVWFREQT